MPETLSGPARRLFDIIVDQTRRGALHPKPPGVATPPEILEACGLDVGEFYALIDVLTDAGLIRVSNEYPFEEIRLTAKPVETMTQFDSPPADRYFEDYVVGHVHELGAVTVSENEIIDFARQFDPQYFHVDPDKAKASRFGGIIASGWHTTSLVMRIYVDRYLSHVASLASPGVDEIRWPNPVRPGDILNVRVTILESRLSRTKPDRGIIRGRVEAFNQRNEPVLSMIGLSIIGRRSQA